MQYYIAENGQPAGPFSIPQLLQRGLNPNSQVWCETMTQWTLAAQVPELMAAINAATPSQQPAYARYTNQPQQPQQPAYAAPQAPRPAATTAGGYTILPQPTIQEAVRRVFQPYVNFQGRARRSEYWLYAAAIFCVNFILTIIDLQLFGRQVLSLILSLAVLIPGLGVCVRRLHDIGKSGWWLLISAIPLVGAIILIIFFCKDGDPEPNQYGPSTKYQPA